MEEFSRRLNLVMKLRNMKQVELCEATGISKSALSQYLSGRIKPRQQRMQKLAAALDVEPGWLLGFDASDGLSERERQLIAAYRGDLRLRDEIDRLLEEEAAVIFRAAKSQDRSVAPGSELMTRERLDELKNAPETDQDL